MARSSFIRRTVRKVLRGANWLKSVGRYNERFPQIFRADKWRPASESLWMNMFGMRTSPLSLVGTRRRGRNNLQRLLRVEGLEQKQLLAADVYVNDNWVITADNDASGTLTTGDTVASNAGETVVVGATFNDPLAPIPAFATIQDGVDFVDLGGTVHVLDGVYTENVTIGSTLHLSGEDDATVTLHPLLSAPNPGGAGSLPGGESNIVLVEANDVEISGINFDGNRPAFGGAIDARNGIIVNHNLGTITGLDVHDVTVQNIFLRGIQAGSTSGTFTISNNTVTNVQQAGDSYGIANFGGSGTISGNVVSNAAQGIVTDESQGTTITGNTVNAPLIAGIASYANGSLGGVADTISGGNLVQGAVPASDTASGIVVFLPSFPVTVSGNTVTDVFTGLHVGGAAGGSVLLTSNIVSRSSPLAFSVGVLVTNDDAVAGGTDTLATLTGNTVNGYDTGLYAQELTGPFADTDVVLSISSGTISLGLNSVLLEGDMKLSGDSLGTLALNGPADFYIGLLDAAYGNGIGGDQLFAIDARNVTFDGKTGTAMTPAERATLESKLFHEPDVASLGFILTENPPAATVSIAVTDGIAAEPADDGKFTISLSAPVATDTTITYSVIGSATNSVDYQFLSGLVVIPAGMTSADLLIDIIDDVAVEGPETVFIALSTASSPSGVAIDPMNDDAQLTIADNDPTAVPPVVTTNTGSTVAEGGTDVITQGELETTDPDTAATGLTYTVTVAPVNGTVRLSGVPTTTFTQADINAGIVTYLHNGSETLSDSFTFTVTDGTSTTAPAAFAITVTPVNDAPVITTNTGSTVAQGGTDTIAQGELETSDADTPATGLTYTVTSPPVNGTLSSLTFTQAQINAGTVTYTHNGSATTSDSFGFSVSDGTTSVPGTFAFTVTPVATATASISVSDGSAGEPANDGEFTVTLSQAVGTTTTITYNVMGTATNGTDYQMLSGFVQIPAGSTTATLPVDVIDDALVEGAETVFVALSTASGGVVIDPVNDEATLTIADNDPTFAPPVITTNTGSTAPQGGTDVITQTELETMDPDTPPSGLTYTVTTPPVNGSLSSLSFTQAQINAGTVTYTHNGSATTSDSFNFNVSDGISTVSGTFSITVQPGGLVSIAVSDGSAGEPANDGAFTVNLSQPSATTTTITYNVLGTASNGTDYQMLSGFLQIPAGSTSAPLLVDIIDDTLFEGTETVLVALSTVSGSPGFGIDAANDEAQLAIADNDVAAPTISVAPNDPAAAEVLAPGAPNPGSFRVMITPTSPTATTVNYTVGGTASNGTDYAAISNSVIIPANTAFVDIPINVVDDAIVENTETVIITLNSSSGTPGAIIDLTPATVNIADNDATQVTISASDPSAAEPADDGAFTFTLAQPSSSPTTVNVTFSGTATNNADYKVTTPIVIPANTTTLVVPVDVIDDTIIEGSETVIATINSTDNGNITAGTPNSATVTIADNDPVTAATVSIVATDPNASEVLAPGTPNPGLFTISLSQPSGTDTTIAYTIAGTAANGIDYAALNGFVVITAGNTTAPVPVNVIDDLLLEPAETVTLTLFATSNPAVFTVNTTPATVTITDNELNLPPVVTTNTGSTVAEGGTDVITQGELETTDADTIAANLVYTVTTPPSSGTINVSGSPASSFTQAQINAGIVTYVHGGAETTSDVFTFSVSDGTTTLGGNTFTITVTPVNDAPVVANPVPDQSVPEESGPTTINVTNVFTDPDPGDKLTLTVSSSNSSVANASLSGDGKTLTLTYTPNQAGTATITLTATDTKGAQAVDMFNAKVVNVNDPVTAVDDIFTTPENKAVSGNVLANDTDPDNLDADPTNDTLTAALLSAPTKGTLLFNTSGAFTYTPNPGFASPPADTFTYRVFDNKGTFDDAVVTINVTNINQPPNAVDDKFTTQRNTAVTGNVKANDSDPDGDPTFTTLQSAPANGTVVLQSDGSFTYTPNAGFTGTDTFQYLLSDGQGGTDVATVTIVVEQVVGLDATDDVFGPFPEDTQVTGNLLANDVDPEGDKFALISTTAPSSGTLIVDSAGNFTYTPFPNFFGTDSFTYTIQDAKGVQDTAKVTLTFTPVNDVDAVNDVFSTKEDTALTVAAPGVLGNDFDPDINAADQHPITGVTAAAGDSDPNSPIAGQGFTGPTSKGGTVTVQTNGSFVYTPAPNFQGADTFTYSIADGFGATDTATVTINVGDINDAPDAIDDKFTVNEDSSGNFLDVLENDTDLDGDKLSVLSVTAPSNGTVTIVPGVNDVGNKGGGVIYTPNVNFFGTDTFTYTASDGRGGKDTATVTVIVSDTPDVPSPVDDKFIATEDQVVTLTETQITSNDFNPNVTPADISSVDMKSAVGGTVVLNADDSVTFTPTANFTGDASFKYFLTGSAADDFGVVTITYQPVNDAPDAGNDSFPTNKNTPITVTTAQLLGNDTDPENDPLTVVGVSNPMGGTVVFNMADGKITFTPATDFTGPASFNYTISDSKGGFDTALVTINVAQPNRPPVAVDDLPMGAPFITVDEAGPDGTNHNRSTRIEFPRANLLTNDTDPDGNPITFDSLVAGSAVGGTVSLTGTNNVTVRFDSNVNFVGDASFEYKISDGQGAFDIGKVTLRFKDTNDPPVANNETVLTDEDQTVTINVLANDTDADFGNAKGAEFDEPTGGATTASPEQLRVVSVGTAANGQATIGPGGVISYNPNANFVGKDSFSYTIADLGADNIAGTADDATSTATVTVDVAGTQDVIALNDSFKVAEDTIRNPLDVLKNDFDPDTPPDSFKVTAVTQGSKGVVEIGANGANVLYTPDPNFVGIDTFTYTITDAKGAMDGATVTVEVLDLGEPPVAVDDAATVIEDSPPTVINVRANDFDPDHPTTKTAPAPSNVLITAVTQGKNGTVAIRAGQLDLVYQPNANFTGTDTFTYTIRDAGIDQIPNNGDDLTDTATVTVTVVNLPDAPDAQNDTLQVFEGSKNNTLNVLANDVDLDGDPLTITKVTTPQSGTATIAPDGKSIVYTPNANFSGPDIFQYTISDPSGQTDSATVLVDVIDVGPNFTGTEGDDIFYIRLNAAATQIEVFRNATGAGTPVFTQNRTLVQPFSFNTLGGNDRLIVDLVNGDPLPNGGITFDGGAGTDMFEVRDIGTSSGVFTPSGTTAGSGVVTLGTGFVTLTGVEPIDITGLSTFRVVTPNANDTLTLTSPAVNTAQLNGASGAMTLGTVTFRDVGTFIIDTATNDAGAGTDSLTVTPGVGRTLPNNVGFLEYRSGTGANTLNLTNGTARINSTVAAAGTLDTTVGANAALVTTRFRQNTLALGTGARATVLAAGTLDAVSRLNGLSIDTGATLDINDNSLVVDYAAGTPAATVQAALSAIRAKILEGRGGAGIGNGNWNGTGITSSSARAANLLNPESRSIGYADNGSLPLGPYTNWRGQAVDTSAFLIGFTRTGDATLDSLVNDDDATILGAFFMQPNGDHWFEADFDYSGKVGDDDATLLGAFFDRNATAFPAPAPAPAPLAAAGEAVFAEIGSGSGSSSSGGVNISAADLAALADEIFAEEESTGIRKTKYGV